MTAAGHVDGMPPMREWAQPPKTCLQAIEDEIRGWCLNRDIEPFRLQESEKHRLTGLLDLWGVKNNG